LKDNRAASLLEQEVNHVQRVNNVGVVQILHIQEELDYVINNLDILLDPDVVSEENPSLII
jgi:hypothetical protein